MHKERLLKLAEVLENFKEERKNLATSVDTFDLGLWHCGTEACAVGTAMLHPWFNKRGLKAAIRFDELESGDLDFMPVYKAHEEWRAVEVFFDIDAEDAMYLFSSGKYSSDKVRPNTVAKRIRSFVDNGGVNV